MQYNPLYFASAVFVLVGVVLLSEGLARFGPGSGEVGLTAILELYQWMLIGAAALLFRREGQRRPAVILGIVALVYLGDPTFQLEGLALLSVSGLIPALLWGISAALKLRALAWAFRLRLSPAFLGTGALGALLLALLPHLRTSLPELLGTGEGSRELLVGGMMLAIFAVGACTVLARPVVTSRETLAPWGQTVLARTRKAAAILWFGLAAAHLATWSLALGAQVVPSLLAVGLLVASLRQRRELSIGARVAAALGLGLLGAPGLYPLLLLLAAVTTGLLGWKHAPRLWGVATVFLYLAAALMLQRWGLASALPLAAGAAGLLLLFLLWRYRDLAGLAGLLLIGVDLGVRSGALREPRGPLEWGATLLALGFGCLAVGLAVNLWSRTPAEPPETAPPPPEPPLRVV